MNTLVLHTDSLAVTEYDTPFTGLSGDFEATADGLFSVGSTLDDTARIPVTATFGMPLTASKNRQRPQYLYVFGTGLKGLKTTVLTSGGSDYTYPGDERHDRAMRFTLGRGIRDNYLQFQIIGTGIEALAIDRAEFVTAESSTRRL